MAKRPMRGAGRYGRRWLWPALLLLLCAALAGAYLLIRAREKAPAEAIVPEESTAVTFENRDTDALARLEVTTPAGEAYTIAFSGGEARMAGDADFRFNEALLEPIVQNACLIITEETILDMAQSALTWADFGLESDCVRVRAVYTDDTEIVFYVGDPLPEEVPTYYFRVAGDTRLFNISMDVYEAYAFSPQALHAVADPSINAELLDAMDFAGDMPFCMALAADGWHLTAPFAYPLSPSAVSVLLSKVEGVRFAQYVGRQEAVNLSDYGLDAPRRTVTFTFAPTRLTGYDESGAVLSQTELAAYDAAIVCGADANAVGFYCLYKGEAVKATTFSAGFLLTQEYDTLLLTAPFNYPTNALTRLVWTRGEDTRAYDLTLTEHVEENNALATDEAGNILYDVTVSRDGIAADGDAFLRAYMEMAKLQATARLPAGWAPAPDARPALSVTLEHLDGVSRTVDFYTYDALHWAMAVDGVALYYVDAGWADAVQLP